MAWYDESPTLPSQTLIDFVERLQQQGISLVDLVPPGDSKRGRDFIAETPIGRIWFFQLSSSWMLRLRLSGMKYFANAAEWKACLKGKKIVWRTPGEEESVVWLDEVLSGVLWVLWTLLKNGISRLLSGFGSIVGGRGWGFGTLALSGVVSDCNVTRSRLSHPL